jgi:alpha-beta hydrolase superfamily lysophospholipase
MPPVQPFYFGPAAHPVFGWYHPPATGRGDGVVLCNPLGLDATRAHRSYRHLAERLAGKGVAVLRFDWHGTGDSSGDDHEPARVATWMSNLNLAIDELKVRSGTVRPSLVGLRAGATLAAQIAAERDDIGALVLWMPALTGVAWVAEMAKLHKLYLRIVPQTDAPEPDGEELLGSFASNATITDLARIDLFALTRRPAPRILIVDEGVRGAGDRLATLGAEVERQRHSGQKFLLTVPHRAKLPDESIDAIVRWLRALPPSGTTVSPSVTPKTTPFDERPVRFGAGNRLFGILVPSPETPPSDRPAIVLLNAGSVNRTGPHRLYVTLARRWAALGFTVLRIDLSGLGDSPAADGTDENHEYPRDALADTSAAMDFLATETGACRFIIAGLCSGADHAYQIARRDDRIAGIVMMNPRTFLELDLSRVEEQPSASRHLSDAASRESALRVPAGLKHISERGVETLLIVGDGDPGVDFVDRHAPAEMRECEALPRFLRVNISGTDHTFTTIASQKRVVDLTTSRYLVRHKGT